MKDQSLKVSVEVDELVIRIGIDTLKFAANNCPASIFLDDEGEQAYMVSGDADFVKSVISALNNEEEDGTTLMHKMFDDVFCHIVEQGELGIDEI